MKISFLRPIIGIPTSISALENSKTPPQYFEHIYGKIAVNRSSTFQKFATFGKFFAHLGIVGIFGILMSCNSKPTPSVNHAVSPFDTTHFETQALTPEDRVKLANATGKTVRPIEIDALAAQINNATGKLHLFCFWNLGSANSVSTLKAVNSLSAKLDSTKLEIIFVNMPGRQTMEAINLFIRENQLSDETLILEKADVSFFSKRIKKDFTGIVGLPVIILANKADKTMQFYNRLMDEKELSAIIQPLL
jgi:hypothetical protein